MDAQRYCPLSRLDPKPLEEMGSKVEWIFKETFEMMIFTLSNSLNNYCGIESKLHAKHASFHANVESQTIKLCIRNGRRPESVFMSNCKLMQVNGWIRKKIHDITSLKRQNVQMCIMRNASVLKSRLWKPFDVTTMLSYTHEIRGVMGKKHLMYTPFNHKYRYIVTTFVVAYI